MSNELSLIPTPEEYETIQKMAKVASDSKYFDKVGGPAGIMAIGLYAREIGVPVMSAIMGGLQNVMGKITMSAELMNSLIRQKGNKLEILESTDKICRIKGTRKDTGETYTAIFTYQDAERAGLVKSGGGYSKHTDDMLFARCISKLKRRLFPDIACKAYVEGELDSPIDVESPVEAKNEPETIEVVEEPHKPMMTDEQAKILNELIGDDEEYRRLLFAFFKVASFQQIEGGKFGTIMERIKKHNEIRIQKEMEMTESKPMKEEELF